MTSRTPASLLDRYLEQRDALRRLFTARGGPQFADDLLQDLFLKVQSHDEAEAISNPDAFLYRLAMNLMIDKARQRRRSGERETAWRGIHHATVGKEDVADVPDSEQAVIARNRVHRLNEVLAGLPQAAQQAFRLVKFDGLSHAEAGARMNLAPRAVERLIAKAMKSMIAKLEP